MYFICRKLVPDCKFTLTRFLPIFPSSTARNYQKKKVFWWFQRVLKIYNSKIWTNGFLIFIKKNWNSLFHYYWDLLYATESLTYLSFIFYSCLFKFHLISNITNQFWREHMLVYFCVPFFFTPKHLKLEWLKFLLHYVRWSPLEYWRVSTSWYISITNDVTKLFSKIFSLLNRVRNNGWSSVMTGWVLGMTCQIIVIRILCPVIHFSHIHNSLLHYIITSVIIDFFFGIHLFCNHRKIFLCSKGRYTYDVHENWPIFKNLHPLVKLLPKFFHPLDLGRPISNEKKT